MPVKWDDKSERDLLLAMRMVENRTKPVTQANWLKTAEVMQQMGHQGVTWTGISQRWTKVMQKDFVEKYPEVLGNAAGTAAPGTTQTPASTPTRRRAKGGGRKRKQDALEQDDLKQEKNVKTEKNDESDESEDELAGEKAPVVKKQKTTHA
ncbi:hypothetical protein GQX73_g233 [Xylaria multiplex]|uniref:Uncharacterized protein n=1 Tax=Xylaria multiplex TaxID=323545 RepID=A0A7C8N1H2_9PEZI|nr:hypothetical protein GQX73_g233 [Xylaria multiplex]